MVTRFHRSKKPIEPSFWIAKRMVQPYYDDMSKRLIQMMQEYVTKNGGQAGIAELSIAAGRGSRMIERYISGQVTPNSSIRYKLALACGCSEREALAVASEGPQERARKSA